MDATSSSAPKPPPRVSVVEPGMTPGWHESIYTAHVEIEEFDSIVPGVMLNSAVVKAGSDGFKVGVKVTGDAGSECIGIYLFKVLFLLH